MLCQKSPLPAVGGEDGEGGPNIFLSCPPPPPPSPIEGGGDDWGDLKCSFAIFNVHTIMDRLVTSLLQRAMGFNLYDS
jgi:hypothetical protein